MVWTIAVGIVGLAGAFLIGWLLPALEIVAFFLAFLLVVGVAGVLQAVVERRWVFWFALPTLALTGIGVLTLAADVALASDGRRTEVVVAEHEKTVRHGANGTTYTHTYTLEHPDGRPLEQQMTYRGKSGFEGAEEGATITVLLDPAGGAPVRPADAVDVRADVAVLTVGLLAASGMCTACLVSVRRQARTVPQPGVRRSRRGAGRIAQPGIRDPRRR